MLILQIGMLMLLDPEAPKAFLGEENEDNSTCGFVAILPTGLLRSEACPPLTF